MLAKRGTLLHEHARIVFPDRTIDDGSIWQLDTGLVYAEVDDMWYAIDVTVEPGIWRLRDDGNGNPILQGLEPLPETKEEM